MLGHRRTLRLSHPQALYYLRCVELAAGIRKVVRGRSRTIQILPAIPSFDRRWSSLCVGRRRFPIASIEKRLPSCQRAALAAQGNCAVDELRVNDVPTCHRHPRIPGGLARWQTG